METFYGRSKSEADGFNFNEGYNDLLEREEQLVQKIQPDSEKEELEPSTIGISEWTPQEKATLLREISCERAIDWNRIAKSVPTKSRPELQTLLSGISCSAKAYEDARRHTYPTEVPAAAEVDSECEQALDDAGETLAEWQLHQEAAAEERRYGDYWLLDWACADTISTASYIASPPLHKAFHDANSLFNIKALLSLSSRMFMSSQDAEADWETHSAYGPSMFCSAFLDLHKLVIAVTKRLLASSLFIAQSRLRATARYSRRRDQVRNQDVNAAVDILNLPNWRKYWIKVPRRCRLRVVDGKPRFGSEDAVFDYSDVEDFLSGIPMRSVIGVTARRSADSPGQQDQQNNDSDSDEEAAFSDDSETQELELKDKWASVEDKRQLYKVMHLETPEDPRDSQVPLPQPPRKKRKLRASSQDRHGDWREHVDYRAEWEYADRFARERSVSPRVQGPEMITDENDSETSGRTIYV